MMRFSRLALGLMAALVATPALAIDIDGKVNADEWQGATHVTDFKQVQPETLADAKYRTEAWYLPTPKGMAVAIRNYQPAEVKRTRTKSRRDEGGQYDRNNVFIDFDGNGVQAYEFTVSIANGLSDGVITGENQFREDWDGDVQHATSETDEYWDMEILIPWHVATMNKAKDGKRTIGEIIGVPASAYAGNWTFLQLAAGYVIGRMIVSTLFLPRYFRGAMVTSYQLLQQRFGSSVNSIFTAQPLVRQYCTCLVI